MTVAKLAVCCALAVTLAGCDLVSSTHPVGRPLGVEPADWEGTWVHGNGALTVRVADAERGLLEVAWVEEKEGAFVLETVDAHLGRFEDWTFASFAGVEETADFLWSRLARDGQELILWWPRPEELRRLVEEGQLPGKVENGDVRLGRLEADHLAILVSEEHGMLFDWDEPMTFRRLR